MTAQPLEEPYSPLYIRQLYLFNYSHFRATSFQTLNDKGMLIKNFFTRMAGRFFFPASNMQIAA